MKYFFLSMIFPSVASEICLRLLGNERETRIIERKPGQVWHWNAIMEKFEHLEALTLNDTALCSVNTVNDLRGKTLVVDVNDIYPYVIINANEDEVTGLIGDAWRILETALKFKYALFVQSNDAIIAKWRYIGIFSRSLWIVSLTMIACIACCIMGMYRFKKFMCINYKDCDDELASPSFNFLCILGSFCGQGFQKIPKSLSLQLIILSNLMMGMLLTCGFSSTLISCLASKENTIPLANLEDVAIKRTHSLCVRNKSSAYTYFTMNGSMYSDFHKEWKGLINKGCPDMRDSATLLSKLCRPGFAYLELPEIFLSHYKKIESKCNIVQLPDNYWRIKLAFLHARTVQHRQLIDTYIIRMRSAGILKYLEKKWMLKESRPNYFSTSNFQPVRFKHIRLSILLFFTITALSIIICILENIWYKLKFKKKPSNLILRQTCNSKLKVMKTCYKMRPKFKWRQKFNSTLLSGNINNPEFFQNVTVQINRW
nr:PREDICTED: uncharacterized protein LOC105676878 [Linepithema humile]